MSLVETIQYFYDHKVWNDPGIMNCTDVDAGIKSI